MFFSDSIRGLQVGAPVEFRGIRLGTVAQVPYMIPGMDQALNTDYRVPVLIRIWLVTTNVRFWKDSGIAVDMSASGMRVEMGSLTTLFSGGVSFDVPDGWDLGEVAQNKADYHLYDDQRVLDSPPLAPPDAKGVRIVLDSNKAGQLNPGDPVLFRGYRVGTVETSTFDTDKRMMTYQLFVTAPYDGWSNRRLDAKGSPVLAHCFQAPISSCSPVQKANSRSII
ncbi:hypothetical protein CRX72_13915, partial [Pantoea sp. BRM17]